MPPSHGEEGPLLVGNWSGTRPQAVDRQTQPAPTLWSALVLPGKGYEASNTEGPPGRRWKEGSPSPLRLQAGSYVCPVTFPETIAGGRRAVGWRLRSQTPS